MTQIEKVKEMCDMIKAEDPCFLKAFSGFSENTKNIILKEVEKYQKENVNSKKSSYIICELIRRFLSPSLFLNKKFHKIKGPVSIYQLSHKNYPHIFYLFGDDHRSRETVCPEREGINQYIKSLVENSPVFIDVYIEYQYYYKNYFKYIDQPDIEYDAKRGFLDESYFLFDDCFNKKNSDACTTSRFHYTDVRFIFESEEQVRGYSRIFEIRFKSNVFRSERNIKDIKACVDFKNNKNSFIYKRLEKQIENIDEDKIRAVIRKMYDENVSKKFNHKIPTKESSRNEQLSFMYAFLNFFVTNDNNIIDIYVLSRCFRKFKKTERYSFPSYNNIIYFGASHIFYYLKVLETLGFKVEFKDEGVMKLGGAKWFDHKKLRCIDISQMEQPMFCQRYKK